MGLREKDAEVEKRLASLRKCSKWNNKCDEKLFSKGLKSRSEAEPPVNWYLKEKRVGAACVMWCTVLCGFALADWILPHVHVNMHSSPFCFRQRDSDARLGWSENLQCHKKISLKFSCPRLNSFLKWNCSRNLETSLCLSACCFCSSVSWRLDV